MAGRQGLLRLLHRVLSRRQRLYLLRRELRRQLRSQRSDVSRMLRLRQRLYLLSRELQRQLLSRQSDMSGLRLQARPLLARLRVEVG